MEEICLLSTLEVFFFSFSLTLHISMKISYFWIEKAHKNEIFKIKCVENVVKSIASISIFIRETNDERKKKNEKKRNRHLNLCFCLSTVTVIKSDCLAGWNSLLSAIWLINKIQAIRRSEVWRAGREEKNNDSHLRIKGFWSTTFCEWYCNTKY